MILTPMCGGQFLMRWMNDAIELTRSYQRSSICWTTIHRFTLLYPIILPCRKNSAVVLRGCLRGSARMPQKHCRNCDSSWTLNTITTYASGRRQRLASSRRHRRRMRRSFSAEFCFRIWIMNGQITTHRRQSKSWARLRLHCSMKWNRPRNIGHRRFGGA